MSDTLRTYTVAMRRIVLSVLVACGGTQPAPAPIQNVEPEPQGSAHADGGIRVVQRGSAGGVIEMQGDRAAAMAAATKEMASVCGDGRYTITQEGEELISSTPGEVATAWRVHYACNQ